MRRITAQQFEESRLPFNAQVEAYGQTQKFCQDLWKTLPDMALAIDRDFVLNPMQHPATTALRDYLHDWMTASPSGHSSLDFFRKPL